MTTDAMELQRLAVVERQVAEHAKRIDGIDAQLASIKRWIKVTLVAVGLAKILPPDLVAAATEIFKALAGG